MKTNIAILGAKAAKKASKMVGFGGGNIPGIIARKVDKQLLRKLSKQVEQIIVVTGTNGKTTTSNLLASIFKAAGKNIIHNTEGNNLITGVTSCFIDKAEWNGKLKKKYDFAVLEVDERNVPLVLKEVEADYVIINNFFRDQMDRNGELDTVVSIVEEAAGNSNATLILNADDPFVMRIAKKENKKIYFGMNKEAHQFVQFDVSESRFCPSCGNDLNYEHTHFGQLGYFSCECGFKRPQPEYEIEKIHKNLTFDVQGDRYHLGVAGAFNILNAIGAIACAKELKIDTQSITKGLREYKLKNGRMQLIEINQTQHVLNLVKNPAGVNITLAEFLHNQDEPKQMVFFLNDLQHDSQDISWIWDCDFEKMKNDNVTRVICSGTRTHDMALRLKYAGVPEEKLLYIENKEKAIDEALKEHTKTYFMPTYTALEPVRKLLEKREQQ